MTKKSIKIVFIMIAVLLGMTTMSKATSSDDVVDYIQEKCGDYVTDSDIVIVERYFKEYPITSDEADQLIAKIDEVVEVLENGTTSQVRQLTQSEKDELKSIANEVAKIIDVNLVFRTDAYVDVYKDGKLIETFYLSNNVILPYTGASTGANVAIIFGIAIVAVAIVSCTYVLRKKKLSYEK